jgi:hypothetical protein
MSSSYDGEWENGMRSGYGVQVFPSPESDVRSDVPRGVYKGMWKVIEGSSHFDGEVMLRGVCLLICCCCLRNCMCEHCSILDWVYVGTVQGPRKCYVYVCMCMYMCTYIHACIRTCEDTYIYIHTMYMYVCISYIHTYIHTYIHIHFIYHTYIHTYIHIHTMYMYVCMHVCMYAHSSLCLFASY